MRSRERVKNGNGSDSKRLDVKPASSFPAGGNTNLRGKLGVGVVGVGEMGRCHARNLRTLVPGAELIAVADVSEERVQKIATELEIDRYFTSLEAMLECKKLHAVIIATPDRFHVQAIQAAADAGKAILCEKPISTTLAGARAALGSVARAGVPLQIGFMRRYDPAYQAAFQKIDAGEIGNPVVFKSVGRDKDIPPLESYRANVNGMVFYNSTIHDYDLARWLMRDEVAEVHAYTTVAIRPEIARYDDVVAGVVNLKFDRGAIGNVESFVQAIYAYDVRTEIVGSKGSIFVGKLQKTAATFLNTNGSHEILEDHYLSCFADAYLAQMRDFVERVRSEQPVRVTGEDGLRALEIAAASEHSHLSGKPSNVERETVHAM
jgi:scyllo-inositol 2-dehydrogenase (NAD+)